MVALKYVKINNLKKFTSEYMDRALFHKDSKFILRQLLEFLYLSYKTGYTPQNYYRYNGYNKKNRVFDIINYIPGRLFDEIRENFLNDPKFCILVQDKFLFNKLIKSHNLPIANLIGMYDKRRGYIDSNNSLVSEECFINKLKKDFVIKPLRFSSQGKGVKLISFDSSTLNLCFDNQKLYYADITKYLNQNYDKEVLIEEKLNQIDELNKLYPYSLSTLRIDTFRKLNGEVVILTALIKIARNNRRVDNWSGSTCKGEDGSIAVPIDINTGCLEECGYDIFLNKYFEHPNTKIKFDKFKVPYFNEVIDTVKKAATIFPNINSLGWDIAIAPNGPFIIEANDDYAMDLSQSCGGPYLNKKVLIDGILDYLALSPKGKKYEKYFNR